MLDNAYSRTVSIQLGNVLLHICFFFFFLEQLKAAKESSPRSKIDHYSRPIFLQHFPMYRKSDEICNEPDEAPEKIKKELFRQKWDCLSEEASEMV